MNSDKTSDDPVQNDGDVGDRNVERLLSGAYDPEAPAPAFVDKATRAMHALAGERRDPGRDGLKQPRRLAWRLATWAVAASILIAVGAILGVALSGKLPSLRDYAELDRSPPGSTLERAESGSQPGALPSPVERIGIAKGPPTGSRMTARSRPAVAVVERRRRSRRVLRCLVWPRKPLDRFKILRAHRTSLVSSRPLRSSRTPA